MSDAWSCRAFQGGRGHRRRDHRGELKADQDESGRDEPEAGLDRPDDRVPEAAVPEYLEQEDAAAFAAVARAYQDVAELQGAP